MTKLKITCGGERFFAVLEEELAPKTCAIFKKILPIHIFTPFQRIITVAFWKKWS